MLSLRKEAFGRREREGEGGREALHEPAAAAAVEGCLWLRGCWWKLLPIGPGPLLASRWTPPGFTLSPYGSQPEHQPGKGRAPNIVLTVGPQGPEPSPAYKTKE